MYHDITHGLAEYVLHVHGTCINVHNDAYTCTCTLYHDITYGLS